ncbi:MAG: phosphoenolpyruvate carboxylase [Acidobacteria bacterium]|nr:phosphoenolpyruvate carboxylase [Acidobacteriota bacterium]
MIQTVSGALEKFQNSVGIKFQLYNSLFLSLPFYGVDKTGILLSLFNTDCEEGYAKGKSPAAIIEDFFENNSIADKLDFLFRFVQYTERQVVLFDALEDAAFTALHDPHGPGTLTELETRVLQENKTAEFADKLRSFGVRLVLTAHPTQFYPGAVLGIINDLVEAIASNDVSLINTYLQQLGRTPFFKKQKPTPFDEANSLIWYLENVFYEAVGNIASDLKSSFPREIFDLSNLVKMGFWPGGDRDGNPFVTSETTLKTADALRLAALRCYYRDTRRLKRRLTFTGVDTILAELEEKLYAEAFTPAKNDLSKDEILAYLLQIRALLFERHNGLFVHLVDNLVEKVNIFGLYFAALDIRQDSSVHAKVLADVAAKTGALPAGYDGLPEAEKIRALLSIAEKVDPQVFDDELTRDTLVNIETVRRIQTSNGEQGCRRYIISHSETALNVIEVFGLFLLGGWQKEELKIDIVPLFETIADLKHAAGIMRELYENAAYREHLTRRGDVQTIMLGFSDGTKDGGYLMANWSIYKAKEELTALARDYGLSVIFFDGRGGPPARGGGKTHKFYSSMGREIASDSFELTIQGQTVSSNFGTVAAAQFNIEQLLHAGIYHHLFTERTETFTDDEEELMQSLADASFRAYEELKHHPHFLDYLSDVSPLKFYAETNIGSRPAKRGAGKLTLDDLRAIPFVGAWSQLKQNVPGFYGVGAALDALGGRMEEIKALYHANLFFRTLVDNCEMAMQKSDFQLTAFLADHETYGPIWRMIHEEFELCRRHLAGLTGRQDLMTDFPVEQQSVRTRERIVLPLTTIQQYALTRRRETADEELRQTLEKLVIRCSFGIINAGRNSA